MVTGFDVKKFFIKAFSWEWIRGHRKELNEDEKREMEIYRMRMRSKKKHEDYENRLNQPMYYDANGVRVELVDTHDSSSEEPTIPDSRDDLTDDEKIYLAERRVLHRPTDVVVSCSRLKKLCCCSKCGTCFTVNTGVRIHVLLALLKIIYDIYDVYTDCEYF